MIKTIVIILMTFNFGAIDSSHVQKTLTDVNIDVEKVDFYVVIESAELTIIIKENGAVEWICLESSIKFKVFKVEDDEDVTALISTKTTKILKEDVIEFLISNTSSTLTSKGIILKPYKAPITSTL